MFCRYCGKHISEDARFCAACGKELNAGESAGFKETSTVTANDEATAAVHADPAKPDPADDAAFRSRQADGPSDPATGNCLHEVKPAFFPFYVISNIIKSEFGMLAFLTFLLALPAAFLLLPSNIQSQSGRHLSLLEQFGQSSQDLVHIVLIILGILAVITVLHGCWAYIATRLNYEKTSYRFFADHLVCDDSFLGKMQEIIPYEKVVGVSFKQGPWARVFGIGDLCVMVASGDLTLSAVNNPEDLCRKLCSCIAQRTLDESAPALLEVSPKLILVYRLMFYLLASILAGFGPAFVFGIPYVILVQKKIVPTIQNPAEPVVIIFAIASIFLLLRLILTDLFTYKNTRYRFFQDRAESFVSFLWTSSQTIWYKHVTEVSLNRDWFQQQFGLGNIKVAVASGKYFSGILMGDLPAPLAVRARLQQLILGKTMAAEDEPDRNSLPVSVCVVVAAFLILGITAISCRELLIQCKIPVEANAVQSPDSTWLPGGNSSEPPGDYDSATTTERKRQKHLSVTGTITDSGGSTFTLEGKHKSFTFTTNNRTKVEGTLSNGCTARVWYRKNGDGFMAIRIKIQGSQP